MREEKYWQSCFITTSVTVDMDNLLIKLETAQRGHYEALPKTPIEIFSIASAGDFSLEN